CNVPRQAIMVLPTAALLTQKTHLWDCLARYKIHQSLKYLDHTERLLQPRDGQIEAKGYRVEVGENLVRVGKLLVKLSRKHPQQIEAALTGFVVAAIGLSRYETALRVNQNLTKLQPKSEVVWFYQGWLKGEIGQKEAAIACYDASLAIKPDYHLALYNKGNALYALGQKLQQEGHIEAALAKLSEGIACYDAALAIKPDKHEALLNKACCYALQGDADSAIQWLQTAIALDPEYRDMAKTDTDFDPIRHGDRFQALVNGNP
ncbi:MAG: tetratricopeptide repeat protein, partial [Nodosilinea sp.]